MAEKENEAPSGSRKPCLHQERWEFIDECKEEKLTKKFVPKNTATSKKWALSNFTSWKQSRNLHFADNVEKQIPDALLESADAASLNKWLALYIAETHKQNGNKYPPKTLYSLLTGLLRYCRDKNPSCPNFLNNEDHRFHTLHNSIDNIMHELRQSGIGSE